MNCLHVITNSKSYLKVLLVIFAFPDLYIVEITSFILINAIILFFKFVSLLKYFYANFILLPRQIIIPSFLSGVGSFVRKPWADGVERCTFLKKPNMLDK